MTEFYEKIKLYRKSSLELMTTSGGSESFGPMLIVHDENEKELLMFVVDKNAEVQMCFLSDGAFRIPVDQLEEIIDKAKRFVKFIPVLKEEGKDD